MEDAAGADVGVAEDAMALWEAEAAVDEALPEKEGGCAPAPSRGSRVIPLAMGTSGRGMVPRFFIMRLLS